MDTFVEVGVSVSDVDIFIHVDIDAVFLNGVLSQPPLGDSTEDVGEGS